MEVVTLPYETAKHLAGPKMIQCGKQTYTITEIDQNGGVHYYDPSQGRTIIKPKGPARISKYIITKKEIPKAQQFGGKCMLYYEFAEKYQLIQKIITPHKEKQNIVTFGVIGANVFWLGAERPTFQPIIHFYNREHMEKVAPQILKELQDNKIPCEHFVFL